MQAPAVAPDNHIHEEVRVGMSRQALRRAFYDNLFYVQELFRALTDQLLQYDPYLLADFGSYLDCQNRVSHAYLDFNRWSRLSVLNMARIGRFSSDRAVREYCREIWRVVPCKLGMSSC